MRHTVPVHVQGSASDPGLFGNPDPDPKRKPDPGPYKSKTLTKIIRKSYLNLLNEDFFFVKTAIFFFFFYKI